MCHPQMCPKSSCSIIALQSSLVLASWPVAVSPQLNICLPIILNDQPLLGKVLPYIRCAFLLPFSSRGIILNIDGLFTIAASIRCSSSTTVATSVCGAGCRCPLPLLRSATSRPAGSPQAAAAMLHAARRHTNHRCNSRPAARRAGERQRTERGAKPRAVGGSTQ
jgi:hypothetical protein